MALSIADLQQHNLILLEAVSGSRAYGLATPESDTDIRGVFYLPRHVWYGLDYVPQVSNETNDVVYYELGRFVELLLSSNPNMLELLAVPEDCVRMRSPLMAAFRAEWFVSKVCQQSFAGYAYKQMMKARGLNKKIVNPMPREKKTVLDFCYVLQGAQSVPLRAWLAQRGWQQEKMGLSRIDHARGLYAMFYDESKRLGYQGVVHQATANHVALSSIAPDAVSVGYLSFNQDGYSSYCREYASYWQWVQQRNEARYTSTQAHGQQYDAKNMMHTFRLLEMACDVARYGEIRPRRPNREALLAIKQGQFTYDDLVARAEVLMGEVSQLFAASSLPEQVNRDAAITALVWVREQLYSV